MKTFKVRWADGTEQHREATDMYTLLMAMTLGEGKEQPILIKQVFKIK